MSRYAMLLVQMTNQQQKQLRKYWREGSEEAWKTASVLFEKRRHAHALFFCHLTLEKILKALIVVTRRQNPAYTHDLRALAITSSILLDDDQRKQLDTISTFNIRARYDTAKQELSRRATRTYTTRWFTNTKALFLWLKKQFPEQ